MQKSSTPCPRCRAPIPADAPGGLCPSCALLGVAEPTNPSQASAAHAPTIEEVAAAFPELEILEVLGQGGMGVVFKARQPRLDRIVALKILPPALAAQPGFAARFTREARVLARLAHPHIVGIYDFGESAGFFYLIMEFVNGVNLRAAMRAGVTPEQALRLVPRICEALQFAHDHGVLHRDIKPENILLDTAGTPKLADFGIAKLAGDETARTGLTSTGAALGTAAYMAPEQIEKPGTVDHRADIYSLGVVFYEMLTGELPLGRFAAPSEKSTVPRGVDEVVMRALEKERERRQQSAAEMRTEVEHATARGWPQVIAPPSVPASDGLLPRIFLALTVLSAAGIPVAGMLDWSVPRPSHMVAFTIVFGTVLGLAKMFAPAVPGERRPALPARRRPRQPGDKDLGIAYLLWFLFGFWGGHKFYLGKTGWGLLYLFTGGLLFVGFLVDLFTLPAQVRAYNEELWETRPTGAHAAITPMPDPWPMRIFVLILALVGLPLLLIGAGLFVPIIVSHSAHSTRQPPALQVPSQSQSAAAVSAGLEDEAIRLARQRLETVRAQVAASVASPFEIAAAARDLAIAEARGDAVKIAQARVLYAEEKVQKTGEEVRAEVAPTADLETAELELNAARQELARASSAAPPP